MTQSNKTSEFHGQFLEMLSKIPERNPGVDEEYAWQKNYDAAEQSGTMQISTIQAGTIEKATKVIDVTTD